MIKIDLTSAEKADFGLRHIGVLVEPKCGG